MIRENQNVDIRDQWFSVFCVRESSPTPSPPPPSHFPVYEPLSTLFSVFEYPNKTLPLVLFCLKRKKMKKGVGEMGNPLPWQALLFYAYIHTYIFYLSDLPEMLNIASTTEVTLREQPTNCLLYADDLVMFARSAKGLQDLRFATVVLCLVYWNMHV